MDSVSLEHRTPGISGIETIRAHSCSFVVASHSGFASPIGRESITWEPRARIPRPITVHCLGGAEAEGSYGPALFDPFPHGPRSAPQHSNVSASKTCARVSARRAESGAGSGGRLLG